MKSTLVHPLILLLVPCCLGSTTVRPDINSFGSYNAYLQPTSIPKGVEESVEKGTGVCTVEDEDEEIKTCYEEIRNYVPLILRKEWNDHAEGLPAVRRIKPSEFVVISDGGQGCATKKACLANLRAERGENLSAPCDLKENFYVGEDGQVYEGRGWEVAPYWYLEGMRIFSITVKFMGRFGERPPNERAFRAFQSTLALGVWMGKLSPNYKIVSIDQVTSGERCPGEALRDSVKGWEGSVDDSVPTSRWEHHENEPLTLASRRIWKSEISGKKTFKSSVKPVRYVLLNNVLKRCNSSEECASQLRALQETQLENFGDVLDNFYIGEDGKVYEGRGWGVLPHWHVEKMRESYISISFLGSFQSELPSRRAIGAFKALIEIGIRLWEISPSFKLNSLRLFYDDSKFLGDALKHHAEKWRPWANELDSMTSQERFDDNFVPLLKRSGRKYDLRHGKKILISEPNLPVNYVIINEGGELCFDVNECTKIVTSERDTYSDTYGDLLDSFYVGGDGMVYEGRGWKNLPPVHLKHLNNSYITVKFLGTFTKTKPNNLTLQAFHSFLRLGVDLGKISPSYQIYSLRHIYDDPSLLGDALSEYVEGLPHWSSEMTVNDDNEREARGLLPIVSRDEWNSISLSKTLYAINGSVQYVFVGETGDRCFSLTQCINQIQEEEDRRTELFGSLTDNFYVGDDGNVYEGLGWVRYSLDNDNETKESAVSVRFFGEFHNKPPSRLAMSAFRRLVKYGVNTKKLSKDYSIVSNRHLCNCTGGLGQAFQRDVEKWDRYSNETLSLNISDLHPYISPFMIVPNSKGKTRLGGSFRVVRDVSPAEYVVISDVGDRCFDREECLDQVNNLPSGRDDYEGFFVGEDGRSYEASGWRTNVYGNYFCPDCNVIFIGFLGKFNYEIPTSNAIDAMSYLLESGIRSGKILPEYKLVSIRQLCSNCSLVGDSLNIAIRSWRNWKGVMNITADCIPFERKVHRHAWSQLNSPHVYNYGNYYRPSLFSEILIYNEGSSCHTPGECTHWMRSRYSYGDVEHNFFIGSDGNVYEGIGWEYARGYNRYQQPMRSTLKVLLIGDLNISSKAAIFAFKKLIVMKGIENGRLIPSYTMTLSNPGNEEVFEKLQQPIDFA